MQRSAERFQRSVEKGSQLGMESQIKPEFKPSGSVPVRLQELLTHK
jgi:hypothetical protein